MFLYAFQLTFLHLMQVLHINITLNQTTLNKHFYNIFIPVIPLMSFSKDKNNIYLDEYIHNGNIVIYFEHLLLGYL